MIDAHCVCQRTHLHGHQGLNASQIAHALALDPRTVSSWRAPAHFHPRTPPQPHRTLDPFTAQRVRMLARSPSAAAQVFQPLRAQGFDGGSAMVKASRRTGRPRRQPALLTLACAPGACAQGDWGAGGAVPVGHTPRRLSGLVMVLCDSRMRSVACPVSQPLEPF